MSKLLPEILNFFPGFIPVNMSAGANASLGRVDMSKYGQCAIVVYKDKGAAAEPVVITVSQHTVATAGTPKALPIPHGVFTKGHADLETIANWTKRSADASPNTEVYTGTTEIELEAFIVIPILAEDLDGENGYKYLSAAIADTVNGAQIGGMFYICAEPRYIQMPDVM